jgi:hypothetical protein
MKYSDLHYTSPIDSSFNPLANKLFYVPSAGDMMSKAEAESTGDDVPIKLNITWEGGLEMVPQTQHDLLMMVN